MAAGERRAPFCWFLCFDQPNGAPYWFSRENAASLWAVPPRGVLCPAPPADELESTADDWETLECPHTRLMYKHNASTNRSFWLVGDHEPRHLSIAERRATAGGRATQSSRDLFFDRAEPGGGFNWRTVSGNREPLSRQFLHRDDVLAIPPDAVAIEGALEKLLKEAPAGATAASNEALAKKGRFGMRYFVLRGRVLSFYKNERSAAAKRDQPPRKGSYVDLALYTVRHQPDSLVFHLDPFESSPVSKPWMLRARNAAVKSRWFDAFQRLDVDVEVTVPAGGEDLD